MNGDDQITVYINKVVVKVYGQDKMWENLNVKDKIIK